MDWRRFCVDNLLCLSVFKADVILAVADGNLRSEGSIGVEDGIGQM